MCVRGWVGECVRACISAAAAALTPCMLAEKRGAAGVSDILCVLIHPQMSDEVAKAHASKIKEWCVRKGRAERV